MSHENAELGRSVVYTLPGRFSDILRMQKFCDFFGEYEGPPFRVCTLDGWRWTSSRSGVPQFVATFDSCVTLDAVIEGASEATLGRLYLEGKLEMDGNVFVLLSLAQYTLGRSDLLTPSLIRSISRFSHYYSRKLVPIHHSRSKENWLYTPCPLDLPASFFEPWLGPDLTHSCSLCLVCKDQDQCAQDQALERICRTLELSPGERLLDGGCGWGSLLLYATKLHEVDGTGIASGHRQKSVAADRIKDLGSARRCKVEQLDSYLMADHSQEFDKVAHLGLFEQVGSSNITEYLAWLRRLVVPGGLVLLHRLTASRGAETCMTLLPAEFLSNGISRELDLAERAGFDLLQVESIQSEYQQTLRTWIERLLDVRRCATTRVFTNAYRAWMLYLVELAKCLDTGEAQVHRVLLKRRAQ